MAIVQPDGTLFPQIPGSGGGSISDAEAASIGMRSGEISGLDVAINGGDAATFDVSAGTGIIIDWSTGSRVITEITYAGATGIAITAGIGSDIFTALYLDSNGDLQQSTGTSLTPQQRRQNIVLNTLVHPNLTAITSIAVSGILAYQNYEAFDDYIRAIGSINTGNGFSAGGANLTIQKAAGTTTLPHINKDIDTQNPATKTNSSQSPITNASEQYRDGVGGFTLVPGFAAIDPDEWDDGTGVLATVANNKWTVRRIYFFGQSEGSLITYGQVEYSSLAEAESGIFTEDPVLSPFVLAGAFKTVLIVKKGATDLTDISEAKFLDIIAQTSTAAAGSGAQDLQNTYDLSTDPEIVTDSTRGAFSVKRGSAADTDNVFEGLNAADTKTFEVDGNGKVTGTDFVGIEQTMIAQDRNPQTGTTYTVLDSDHGKLISFDNASAIAVTIPTGLRSDFACTFLQIAAGKPTFSGGATLLEFDSFFTMAGQYAMASIVQLNASNVFILQGRLE